MDKTPQYNRGDTDWKLGAQGRKGKEGKGRMETLERESCGLEGRGGSTSNLKKSKYLTCEKFLMDVDKIGQLPRAREGKQEKVEQG